MADDQAVGTGAGKPEGSAPGRSPIVFVTDASAEAERIGDTLRALGYVVADVPISMLAARVAAQRPNVVLLDVDAEGVLADLARLRKLPGSGAIDFVYLGSGEGIVKNADDALSNDGSAFFLRPVDVGSLIRKIEALTGGPMARPEARPSTPPPSLAIGRGLNSSPSSSRDGSHVGHVPPSSDRPSTPSLPAPGLRTPGPPLPMSTTSLADLVDAPRSLASFGTVSQELQQLLADAELRAEVLSSPDVAVPSPDLVARLGARRRATGAPRLHARRLRLPAPASRLPPPRFLQGTARRRKRAQGHRLVPSLGTRDDAHRLAETREQRARPLARG